MNVPCAPRGTIIRLISECFRSRKTGPIRRQDVLCRSASSLIQSRLPRPPSSRHVLLTQTIWRIVNVITLIRLASMASIITLGLARGTAFRPELFGCRDRLCWASEGRRDRLSSSESLSLGQRSRCLVLRSGRVAERVGITSRGEHAVSGYFK